ncbi:MAG: metalloregulator ArsR/SmtB family transcription factor [Chloroflexota bacterium]|nr:metalloregulator ArsR/SmtB family transcription factor [Chloroflexota bacterium]
MVRTPARPHAADSLGAPARAIVRDFSRSAAAPFDVEFDVRTLYDFVFSLSDDAGSTDDLPATDRAWLEEAKTTLRTRTGTALELYGLELCVVLAGLAVDRPEVRDAAGLVALVNDLDDAAIARTVVSDDLRDPERRRLSEQALAGDDAAIDELVSGWADSHSPDKVARLRAMYRDPSSIVAPSRKVLTEWLPLFQPIESRIATMIRRDVDARSTAIATLRPTDLIEATTGGIRWLAEPGIRRVILAPSYFARPYNFVFGGEDWRMFGYPIADEALDAGDPLAPPAAVVRLHRALGDETRLRILRLLVGRDHYLTEIASALELSKPTIKHHLALLRAAGLVTLTEEGGLSYYSLRRGTIEANGAGLIDYLLR